MDGALKYEELTRSFTRRLMDTPTEFYRYLYGKINWEDKLIGITGPKGCGKSTLILQHIKHTFKGEDLDKVLYISLDNLWFANNKITDLVETFYTNGGTHLFIDEAHYEPNWKRLLKNLSDDYPSLHIVYTGSSMLQMKSSVADLSRRLAMYEMRGLSFREYLLFEKQIKVEPVSLETALKNHVDISMDICNKIQIIPAFENYLRTGYYPFYKQVHNSLESRIMSMVNQIIEVDYPAIDDVTPATIRKTKKMFMVLAERVPQTPKMTELYRELETDRNQGLKMLNALERGGLLQLLIDDVKSPDNLSRPDKIYINNPTLAYAISPHSDIGTIRETFFMNQLTESHDVRYPKHGDFIVDKKYLFEVGGKNKNFNQIKDIPNSFLAVDDIEVGRGAKIPLWIFGLLY